MRSPITEESLKLLVDTFYVRLTRDFGTWRATVRYDDFRVEDRDSTALDDNREDGRAWRRFSQTLAAKRCGSSDVRPPCPRIPRGLRPPHAARAVRWQVFGLAGMASAEAGLPAVASQTRRSSAL